MILDDPDDLARLRAVARTCRGTGGKTTLAERAAGDAKPNSRVNVRP